MNNPVIIRTPVHSSCIASVGYAETAVTLEVEFRSGAVYRYAGVPREVHAAIVAASSKGTCFNKYVKGRYPAVPQLRESSASRSGWSDPATDGLEQLGCRS